MKIKIVGIEDQNYKLDNGYSFDGLKLHCLDVETKKDKLIGNVTTTIRVPRDFPQATSLMVGMECSVYFNQKGQLDFLQPVK